MHFFDLHAHLLPGVDDGPADLDETVEALRIAYDGGTRSIVATSHMYMLPLHTPIGQLRAVFERTVSDLARLARRRDGCAFLGDMEFALGAENYLSSELIVALERDEVLSLDGGRSLLIEFNPYLSFELMKSALEKVLEAGYTPVLAHVERYRLFVRDASRLDEVVAMGCHAQVNAESVLGPLGSLQRRRAIEFLSRGAATVVASDLHNAGRRRSRLGEAAAALQKRFSSERVREWLADNPRRVVRERRE